MNFEKPDTQIIRTQAQNKFRGFVNFIREQGVVGLAIGFILGGAVSKIVSSLVSDVINPIIGMIFGKHGNLSEAALVINGSALKWGSFVNALVDFIVIAAVVYFGFKALRLERLDKTKE